MRRTAAALTLLLLTAGAAWLAIARVRPPAVVPASAPATDFSAERAMEHVRALAVAPRPVGSEAHARAMEHVVGALRDLGIEPEVWDGVGASPRGTVFGSVRDVIARLPGTGADPGTILLMAHYDSVTAGPGANDDGIGVATLLETLRALSAGPRQANDVVALFSDGEEVGLLGAEAFVHGHPLASHVGMVLNVEARGTRGPSLMFETGPRNLWSIRHFAAAPYPIAASYSYEVYRRLPNDTDYTVFKKQQVPGLNFAHIEGAEGYHTALDSLEHLDPASLQHHGSNVLAIVRDLGDADLAAARQGGDAVYFNPLGYSFVYYPASWVIALLALLGVLTVGVVALGVARRRLGIGRLILGVVLDVVFLAVLGAVAIALRGVLFPVRYDFRIWGEASSVAWTLCGLTLLALGIGAALQRLAARLVQPANAAAAGVVLWFVATAAVSVIAPGGSYLFMVPLLFQLAALAVVLVRGAERGADRTEATSGWTGPLPIALLVVAAVVVALVWAPTLALLAIGLQAGSAMVLAVLTGLLLALLAPQVEVATDLKPRWLVPAVLVIAGLAVVVAVKSAGGFGPDNPRPTSLVYALDADRGEAVWASFKPEPDPWTGKVLPDEPTEQPMPEMLGYSRSLATGPAPVLDLAQPALEALGRDGDTVRVKLVPPAGADRLRILLSPRSALEGVTVAGRTVKLPTAAAGDDDAGGKPVVLYYLAPPADGVEVAVTSGDPDSVRIAAVAQWWGVPSAEQGGPGPLPAGLMQAPWPWDANTTMVRREWALTEAPPAPDAGMAAGAEAPEGGAAGALADPPGDALK